MATFPTYGAGGSSNGGLSFPTYGTSQDPLSTSEGLYQLAQQHGGAVAQAADEIMHPTTGILSSIGDGLKNAFRGFINTISIPSEAIAGIIAPDLTIGQAISQHVTPSDVIFGEKDPNASVYKKIGSFLVRTATDVLLDPLTYVTFGAGEGLLGLRTGSEIALGKNALETLGRKPLLDSTGNIVREANNTGILNKSGDEVYQYLTKLARQMNGTASAEIAKTGNKLLDLSGDELKAVMRASIDSPLSQDFAKKALSNLLEHNPAYTVDLLDKGGIKAFGKTILSGQRIASTMKLIPGMTALDLVTSQPRMAISALFNPAVVKDSSGRYVRLPQEYVDMAQKWGDFSKAMGEGKVKRLEDIKRQFNLTETEARFLTASIEYRRIPSDERLAKAFKATLGFNEDEWQQLVDAGLLSTQARIEGHLPHVLVKNKLGAYAFRMPPSTATGATELRQIAKFTDVKTGQEITGHAGSMGLNLVKEGENAGLFSNTAGDLFRREVAPIHQILPNGVGSTAAEHFGTASDFSSLEEFLGSQMKVFFGGEPFDSSKITAQGISVATNPKSTRPFVGRFSLAGETKLRPKKPQELFLSPQAKVLSFNDIPKSFLKTMKDGLVFPRAQAANGMDDVAQEIVRYAKENGFDAVDLRKMGDGSESEIRVINKAVLKSKDELAKVFEQSKNKTDAFLAELEGTLLKSPEAAAKMLDDMRAQGLQGFDDNAITALAARSLKNTKAVSMKYFLRDLAENFGHDAALAEGRGFQRISSSGVKDAGEEIMPFWSKDGELLYHPAIAAHVENFMGSLLNDDATMAFLKSYDSLQNAWKATVTSIWPAFHGRNALSNVLQNFLDIGVHALDPRINAMSIQMLNADRALAKLERAALDTGEAGMKAKTDMTNLLQKVLFTDRTGHKWTYGELRQVAKNNAIAFTRGSQVTSADIAAGVENSAEQFFGSKSLFGKGVNLAKQPFKFGQDVVGASVEDHARMVNFIANLRNTGDVTLASRRTKQFLFDYSNLTNFEKMFMKRLIPFYTFTRKNLELQVRSLLKTPGRVAAEVHAVDTLGEVISGGSQLSDEEYAALPDWVKSGIGILTKKNGDQITMITNLGTPLEQPFQALQANTLLGSVSPLIRLPVEELSGYSFFEGKPLSEVTNAAAFVHAPKFLQDLIGYTVLKGKKSNGEEFTWYVSLHPEMMNLILNLPPTTRVFSSLKQMGAVDVADQAKIFQQLTGVRPYSFDLQRERDKREKETVDELQDLLTKAGVTAQFKRTFIPKEKKNQIMSIQ